MAESFWNEITSSGEPRWKELVRLYCDKKLREEVGESIYRYLASYFGTTVWSVHSKLKRLRRDGYISYLESRVGCGKTKPVFNADRKFVNEEEIAKKMLELLSKMNELRNERDVRQLEVYPEIDTDRWIGIVFGGDWHVEHYRTNIQELLDTLKTIGGVPDVYYGFMGDFLDVIDIRFLDLENETIDIPLRRRVEIIQYLMSFVPNTLFIVSGCHDKYVRTRGRIDIGEAVHKVIKGYYLGYGGTLNLRVGKVMYRIAAWHKFGAESGYNIFHPNMNYLRKWDATADIVCVAHRHDLTGICYCFWQDKPRVLVRSGSPQYLTEYAWAEGFRGAIFAYPMVLLSSQKKRMLVFNTYRDGLCFLKRLNSDKKFSEEILSHSERGRVLKF